MTRATGLFATFFLLFLFQVKAQDRYMIFFADKAGSTYSTERPAEFLSARAIERRQNQGISIVENDLPVNPGYITTLKNLGAATFFESKWMNAVLVQAEAAVIATIEALDFVTEVEFVAPDAPLTTDGSGADGFPEREMHNAASDFQNEMLGIDAMHEAGYEGQGMLIAVFDEGFNGVTSQSAFAHLFTGNRVLYTKDFTTNRTEVDNAQTHGRRVLSVLAAREPGAVTGTAPEASYILSITEAAGEYRIEEYNWLFAAEMADSAGVDLINTSLGYNLFTDPSMDYSQSQMDGQTAVITRAVNLAASKGIALITSAGNTGLSLEWPIITAPGDSPDILAVAAVNAARERGRISSLGPSVDGRVKPDVAALGIATAVIGTSGGVSFSDGTSFASPLITGLAAGLWQAYPELTAHELLELIRQSGHQYDSPDNELGYGIPDFETATRIVDEVDLPVADQLIAYPNPIQNNRVNLAFDASFLESDVEVLVINSQGKRIHTYAFTPTARDNRILIDLGDQPAGVYLLRVAGTGGIFTKKVIKY